MSRAVEAVYLWLLVTRSRPLPLLRPAPPRLILPILVRVILLLAMAWRVALGGVPWRPWALWLPPVAVLDAALVTSPEVG